ncbi:hypothetical protein ACSBR2_020574 [Camellia fascicularis]
MAAPRVSIVFAALTLSLLVYLAESRSDSNSVYSPCADTTIQKSDGFSFGIAFSLRGDFFVNTSVQLSPCDKRLSLSQLALFRPKVDEISLLTINTTAFSPVLEFNKGRLENLYWKRDGCATCSGNSNFVCLNNQDCAIKTSSCKNHGGSVDCSLGIQLAFSGTDKHESVFNSWYEVKNLRQYSLYGLYSNLKNSLTNQYNSFF